MAGNRRWYSALLIAALVFGFSGIAAAQESDGTLIFGQPIPGQIAAGQTLTYDYALAQPSAVTFQALGDAAQPTITVLRDGVAIAQQNNAEGSLTTALNALLDAGTYVVQVSAANNTAGLVVIFVQSEQPITSTALTPGAPLNGSVDASTPLALYTFTALGEPALLYVESSTPPDGVGVRVVDTTTGVENAVIAPDMIGARLRIPAGSDAYQVEVQHDGSTAAIPYTICLASVSAGGCEAGAAQPVVVQPNQADYCTVAPSGADNVNVRQSASPDALVLAQLPPGSSADVVGISPDGLYYNVLYRGNNGWIDLSVITSSGNCSGDAILTITPPRPVPDSGQQAAVQAPTAAPPTAVPPPVQPTGNCLITMSGDQLVYTQPNDLPDYIFDQVHPGFELIPIARLADNTWWQTNYANAWIQTAVFGTTAQISGNCAGLPVVSP